MIVVFPRCRGFVCSLGLWYSRGAMGLSAVCDCGIPAVPWVCLQFVIVVFLAVPWVCLQFVIVVFPQCRGFVCSL